MGVHRLHIFDIDGTIGRSFRVSASDESDDDDDNDEESCARARRIADQLGYPRTTVRNASGVEMCFVYRPAALRFITERAAERDSELAIWSAADAVYVAAVLAQSEALAAIRWKFAWAGDRCSGSLLWPHKDLTRVVDEFFPDPLLRPPREAIILYDDNGDHASQNRARGFTVNWVRAFRINGYCDKDSFTFRDV